MGAEEKDLELEEINWMMGSGMYIHIGANVRAYWQKSNKDVHSEIMYILIQAYWIMYIYRIYPPWTGGSTSSSLLTGSLSGPVGMGSAPADCS